MLIRITAVFLAVLFCFSVANAQTPAPDAAAVSFYRWYIGELNADRFPIDRSRPAMRKRVSARLAKWLFSRAYREYGADYFLDKMRDIARLKPIVAAGHSKWQQPQEPH